MSQDFSYKDYVTDDSFMESYQTYQQKYAKNIRESDRALIEIIRKLDPTSGSTPKKLLDVGCSTGNLLLHLKNQFSNTELHGADMTPAILEECRNTASLSGIHFHHGNILDLQLEDTFDFITVNAVLYLFDEDEYRRALEQIFRRLKPGGWFVGFDFCHRFPQELAILEKSASHPKGLMLHFRPTSQVEDYLTDVGFVDARFEPFRIPIELPPNDDPNLITYTVKASSGENMLFRGALYQPWCHFYARRP